MVYLQDAEGKQDMINAAFDEKLKAMFGTSYDDIVNLSLRIKELEVFRGNTLCIIEQLNKRINKLQKEVEAIGRAVSA